MICIHCGAEHDQPPHHIIFKNKTQGGTDDPINLASLCFDCHYAIHHGTDSKLRAEVLKTCYEQIRGFLSRCWSAKIKPKIIRILESEGY